MAYCNLGILPKDAQQHFPLKGSDVAGIEQKVTNDIIGSISDFNATTTLKKFGLRRMMDPSGIKQMRSLKDRSDVERFISENISYPRESFHKLLGRSLTPTRYTQKLIQFFDDNTKEGMLFSKRNGFSYTIRKGVDVKDVKNALKEISGGFGYAIYTNNRDENILVMSPNAHYYKPGVERLEAAFKRQTVIPLVYQGTQYTASLGYDAGAKRYTMHILTDDGSIADNAEELAYNAIDTLFRQYDTKAWTILSERKEMTPSGEHVFDVVMSDNKIEGVDESISFTELVDRTQEIESDRSDENMMRMSHILMAAAHNDGTREMQAAIQVFLKNAEISIGRQDLKQKDLDNLEAYKKAIKSGKATSEALLKYMSMHSSSKSRRSIAKYLLGFMNYANLTVEEGEESEFSTYTIDGKTNGRITFNFEASTFNADPEHAILHEIVHSIIGPYVLYMSKNTANQDDKAIFDNMFTTISYIEKKLNYLSDGKYYINRLDKGDPNYRYLLVNEFFAEFFSSDNMRRDLMAVRVNDRQLAEDGMTGYKTAFTYVINAVRRILSRLAGLFGIHKEGETMFDDADELVKSIMTYRTVSNAIISESNGEVMTFADFSYGNQMELMKNQIERSKADRIWAIRDTKKRMLETAGVFTPEIIEDASESFISITMSHLDQMINGYYNYINAHDASQIESLTVDTLDNATINKYFKTFISMFEISTDKLGRRRISQADAAKMKEIIVKLVHGDLKSYGQILRMIPDMRVFFNNMMHSTFDMSNASSAASIKYAALTSKGDVVAASTLKKAAMKILDGDDKAGYSRQAVMDMFIDMSSGFMKAHFGISVKPQIKSSMMTYMANKNATSDFFDEMDSHEIGESTVEKWMVESDTISQYSSLSEDVKSLLASIPDSKFVYDAHGNRVKAEVSTMFGTTRYLNPRSVISRLYNMLNGVETYSEAMKILEARQNAFPWIQDVINAINARGAQTRSRFFIDFSKDSSLYEIASDDNEDGYSMFIENIENVSDDIAHSIIRRAEDGMISFSDFASDDVKYILNDMIKDGAIVDIERAREAYRNFLAVLTEYDDDMIRSIVDNLVVVGNEGVLENMRSNLYIISERAERADKINSSRRIDKQTGNVIRMEFENVFGDKDMLSNIRRFAKQFIELTPDYLDTAYRFNGKMYQNHIIPSFISRLYSRMLDHDAQRMAEFAYSEFLQYPQFCKIDRDHRGNVRFPNETDKKQYITQLVVDAVSGSGERKSKAIEILEEAIPNLWLRKMVTSSYNDRVNKYQKVKLLASNNHEFMRDMTDFELEKHTILEFFNRKRYRGTLMSNKKAGFFFGAERFTSTKRLQDMRSDNMSESEAAIYNANLAFNRMSLINTGNAMLFKNDILAEMFKMFKVELDRVRYVTNKENNGKNIEYYTGGRGRKFLTFDWIQDVMEMDDANSTRHYMNATEFANAVMYGIRSSASNTSVLDRVDSGEIGDPKDGAIQDVSLQPRDVQNYYRATQYAKNYGNAIHDNMVELKKQIEAYIHNGDVDMQKLMETFMYETRRVLDMKSHEEYSRLENIDTTNKNSSFTNSIMQSGGAGGLKLMMLKQDLTLNDAIHMFIWNDTLANICSEQMFMGDPAQYKSAVEFQKRASQSTSPGLMVDMEATDYNGNRVSDGILRTVTIEDSSVQSDSKAIIDAVFTSAINDLHRQYDEISSDDYKINGRRVLKARKKIMLDNLKQKIQSANEFKDATLKAFDGIKETDGWSLLTPSAMRKKMYMFGEMSKETEMLFDKIRRGDYSVSDVNRAISIIKGFTSGTSTYQDGEWKERVYNQHKDSEYMILLADAMIAGEQNKNGKISMLKILNAVGEHSHSINRGTAKTNTFGIDKFVFRSSAKTGNENVIDLNELERTARKNLGENATSDQIENEVINLMESLIYSADPNGNADAMGGNETYNPSYVKMLSYSSYHNQVKINNHYIEDRMAYPSQVRYNVISELGEGEYEMIESGKKAGEGKKMSAADFILQAESMLAGNINQAVASIGVALGIENGKVDMSKLSEMLLAQIENNDRYGYDTESQVIIGEDGRFRLSAQDPSTSLSIQSAIYAMIKQKVNKIQAHGGAVVQCSDWGKKEELSMVFADDNNERITLKDFAAKRYPGMDANSQEVVDAFKDYILNETSNIRLKYYEVYAPMPDALYNMLRDENGNIDMDAFNALDESIGGYMSKLICSRVPNEDRFSNMPCKIVGFTPINAGESIQFPKEIVAITGSDFDSDKQYVLRQMVYTRKKAFSELVDDMRHDEFLMQYGFNNAELNGLAKSIINGKPMLNSIKRKEDWQKAVSRVRYLSLDVNVPVLGGSGSIANIEKESADARNNTFVNMAFTALTHPKQFKSVITPQGFEMLRSEKKYKEDLLSKASAAQNMLPGNEVVDARPYQKSENMATFGAFLDFYGRNQAATQLVGVCAVEKMAHSILVNNEIYLKMKGVHMRFESISIDGTVEDETSGKPEASRKKGIRLDAKENPVDFMTIGQIIGAHVGATVDAAKDPILDAMNINMITINPLMTAIRIGIPYKVITGMLASNVIKTATNISKIKSINGYSDLGKVLDEMKADYEEMIENEMAKLPEYEGKDIKEAAEKVREHARSSRILTQKDIDSVAFGNIAADGNVLASYVIDYQIINYIQKLLKINKSVSAFSKPLRINSMSGALGPTNTSIVKSHVDDVTFSKHSAYFVDKNGNTLYESVDDMLADFPIINAIRSSRNLAHEIMDDMFFETNPPFIQLCQTLREFDNDITTKRKAEDLDDFVTFIRTDALARRLVYDIITRGKVTKRGVGSLDINNYEFNKILMAKFFEYVIKFPKTFEVVSEDIANRMRAKGYDTLAIDSVKVKNSKNGLQYIYTNMDYTDDAYRSKLQRSFTNIQSLPKITRNAKMYKELVAEIEKQRQKVEEYQKFLGGITLSDIDENNNVKGFKAGMPTSDEMTRAIRKLNNLEMRLRFMEMSGKEIAERMMLYNAFSSSLGSTKKGFMQMMSTDAKLQYDFWNDAVDRTLMYTYDDMMKLYIRYAQNNFDSSLIQFKSTDDIRNAILRGDELPPVFKTSARVNDNISNNKPFDVLVMNPEPNVLKVIPIMSDMYNNISGISLDMKNNPVTRYVATVNPGGKVTSEEKFSNSGLDKLNAANGTRRSEKTASELAEHLRRSLNLNDKVVVEVLDNSVIQNAPDTTYGELSNIMGIYADRDAYLTSDDVAREYNTKEKHDALMKKSMLDIQKILGSADNNTNEETQQTGFSKETLDILGSIEGLDISGLMYRPDESNDIYDSESNDKGNTDSIIDEPSRDSDDYLAESLDNFEDDTNKNDYSDEKKQILDHLHNLGINVDTVELDKRMEEFC